jgi:hypothetical protein
MSSGVGWVEAEGAEGKAQKAGIPGEVLKIEPGGRVVIGAMRAAKAERAKDDREEETGWKRERKRDRRKCPKGLGKPEKPKPGENAGPGRNRACGQTGCWRPWKTGSKEECGSV